MSLIDTFGLRDVGPDGGIGQAEMVADRIVDFISQAERSLVLALYDIRLPDPVGSTVADAFRAAAERGVKIRLAYNDVPADPDAGNFLPAVHPPPETNPEILAKLPIETKPVSGIPDLMHHKYMVRDEAAVWTGSANWSVYSWTRQENVLAVIEQGEVAREYLENFEVLWETGKVELSGHGDPNPIRVGDATVRVWFTPGHGEALAQRISSKLGSARQRIRIASPVLTSGPILGTLAELAGINDLDIAGVVDEPQTDRVYEQWATTGSKWKIPLLTRVIETLPFNGKRSVPWGTGAVRDFMHAKVTVTDDTVFLGSFNLSRSGEANAENMIEIENLAIADQMAAFIDEVRARYPRSSVPGAEARRR
ncbi:MAG: phosphatidylserine/phosphatidylglycerophosphate/cardiolipin synthase family protein [Solirubrobacterales bacterium]|nr:phosphatidylserine/phosphatidylglycerophosphate/cardiolipin synthase family protein [Solirubrobacterales bacterium]HMT04659.1 phosphatidylserine/phosphatidylglycerophosphate/cardiolipin synthase family protein [Solirubrobacterales bacterium]